MHCSAQATACYQADVTSTLQVVQSCKMLRKILSHRLGRHVSAEQHWDFVQNMEPIVTSSDGNVKATVIDPGKDDQAVKAYMYRTFYTQAPIPTVLKLSRNCDETKHFLEKELNLFINSGVSIKFCDSINHEILGIGLSVIWKRNPNYEIIGAPVKEWHNTAASIARTFPEDERHIIWRDLQWQHIYDVGQTLLCQTKKPKVLYKAMLILNPDLRSSSIANQAIDTISSQNDNADFSRFVQSNFRAFDKNVNQIYKNPQLLDEVKYSDEQLILNETEGRAFKIIDHLHGIRFFADP